MKELLTMQFSSTRVPTHVVKPTAVYPGGWGGMRHPGCH